MKKVIFSLFVAIIFFSCNKNVVFSEFHEVSNAGWNKDTVFSFEFDITDTLATCEIVVMVRNTDDFPRQNLWLGIEITKDNNVFLSDTTNLFLSDDYGKWRGRGVGSYFDNEFSCKNVTFYKSGKYICNLRHIMRFDDLKGLKYIGLKILKKND